jgi:P4 family phage/plasmid primase-like protien
MFSNYPELRFCKLKKGTKKPFEMDWVHKPYDWNEIQEHIKKEQNYGVLCGYGGLIVIDSDTNELREAVEKGLPKSLRILTGGGGTHDYYICKELKKKIVLQTDKHFGEVQSFGTQVVGAGSIHPNGNLYKNAFDGPITEITLPQLTSVIKPFMKEIKDVEDKAIGELKDYGETDINSIGIMNVMNNSGFKKSSGKDEYFGINPWHGSATGMNTWINPSKNVAFCFRCNVGINVAKAIALNEGIIRNCYDDLSKDNFLKVLDIAHTKYGLKKKEKKSDKTKAALLFTDTQAQAEQYMGVNPVFYDKTGMFWIWNDNSKCWEISDEIDILNIIERETGQNTVESKKRTEIINALKQGGRKKIPSPVAKTWIQFHDTIFDIATGLEFKASPEYFSTNPIPWRLHPEKYMNTPTLDKIFEEWVGKDKVQTLYEIIAYCLLPDYPINRLFCFVGGGMNGKSSFIEFLKRFLGYKNVTSTELDILMTSRFEIARFHKKLLCVMGETNFSEMTKTSILKKLTGGDYIGFEYKNKQPFEDYNYAKIIIATNNLPATTDKTIGFYRRWLIVDFPNQFSERKNILDDIPQEEYECLALRCCFVLKDLLNKRAFHNEGTVEDRAKKFEEMSNPLDKFVKEFCEQDLNGNVISNDFAKKLNQWLTENRYRAMAENSIGKQMKLLGFEKTRKYFDWMFDGKGGQAYVYFGLRWK